MRTAVDPDIPLEVPAGPEPLGVRIARVVADAVDAGRIVPGTRLPGSRVLAARLGVSRGSVLAAYDYLTAIGTAVARPGSGTVVVGRGRSDHGVRPGPPAPARPVPEPAGARWDLLPGRSDPGLLHRDEWRRAWRRAVDLPLRRDPGRDPRRVLREQIAVHLQRWRGWRVDPSRIVLMPSTAAGLRTVATAVGVAGRAVVVEDPGYRAAGRVLAACGGVVTPVPVDEQGLDPAGLPAGAALAYVTPAHQFPLGGRLPAPRRARLLDWAAATGAVLVEDDYDGEFRFGTPPLPSLAAQAGADATVAYLGTTSKTLAAAGRMAWLVVPDRLRAAVTEAVLPGDDVNPVVAQAVALLMAEGTYARQLRRARRVYAHRRESFVAAVSDAALPVRVLGLDAGLHVVLELAPGTDDAAACRALAGAGLVAEPLSGFAARPSAAPAAAARRGLVLADALLPEDQTAQAVAVLARVLRRLPAGEVSDRSGGPSPRGRA